MSGLFKINLQDVSKSIALVVIVAFLGAVQQAITAHGFDIGSYDWSSIFDLSMTAGIGYLIKNYLSTSNGAVLGKIGGQ